MIDTHLHLSHHLFDAQFSYLARNNEGGYTIQQGTREELMGQLLAAGVSCCIDPGISIVSNEKLLTLAERWPGFVYGAVGGHPTRTWEYKILSRGKTCTARLHWKERRKLDEFLQHPAVVAVGETGLDYHHPRKEHHRLRQMAWFIYQLRLAHRHSLPLILHIREADTDALRILKRSRHWLHGGVCHCFCGTSELAAAYTALGLKLGIGGSLLTDGPRARRLEQAVAATSLEFLLLETDGPYVLPSCPQLDKKKRRKVRNTSLILPAVAERIAELKNVPVEEVLRVTSENAVRLFGLPSQPAFPSAVPAPCEA